MVGKIVILPYEFLFSSISLPCFFFVFVLFLESSFCTPLSCLFDSSTSSLKVVLISKVPSILATFPVPCGTKWSSPGWCCHHRVSQQWLYVHGGFAIAADKISTALGCNKKVVERNTPGMIEIWTAHIHTHTHTKIPGCVHCHLCECFSNGGGNDGRWLPGTQVGLW